MYGTDHCQNGNGALCLETEPTYEKYQWQERSTVKLLLKSYAGAGGSGDSANNPCGALSSALNNRIEGVSEATTGCDSSETGCTKKINCEVADIGGKPVYMLTTADCDGPNLNALNRALGLIATTTVTSTTTTETTTTTATTTTTTGTTTTTTLTATTTTVTSTTTTATSTTTTATSTTTTATTTTTTATTTTTTATTTTTTGTTTTVTSTTTTATSTTTTATTTTTTTTVTTTTTTVTTAQRQRRQSPNPSITAAVDDDHRQAGRAAPAAAFASTPAPLTPRGEADHAGATRRHGDGMNASELTIGRGRPGAGSSRPAIKRRARARRATAHGSYGVCFGGCNENCNGCCDWLGRCGCGCNDWCNQDCYCNAGAGIPPGAPANPAYCAPCNAGQ